MKIGIIGGTGLDDPQILLNRVECTFDGSQVNVAANGHPADYGKPSDDLITGSINYSNYFNFRNIILLFDEILFCFTVNTVTTLN